MEYNYKIQEFPECCAKCKLLLGWNYAKNGFVCSVQKDVVCPSGKCDKYIEDVQPTV